MRTWLYVGWLCLLPVVAAAQPSGQATLAGTVVDAETGDPLPGAHVFIAQSTRGTTTDADGRFRLADVPLGAQRLYVSMLGYAPATRDTLLRDARTYHFRFRLEPEVIDLEGITVTAERDRKWARRLRKFEREFLGTSVRAEQTTILNPEVLSFDGGWGRLEAWAQEPLLLENRALGYRIRYFLEEFERTGGTVRYDGEPLFELMTPKTPEQAAAWAEARRRAFQGSFHHFLVALLDGRTREAGFLTFRRFSLDRTGGHRMRFGLDPQDLIRPGPTPAVHLLDFSNYVEIVYTGEDESDAFLRWHGAPWNRPGPQRSWIELTDRPARVDRHGEVVDPYGVTVYGYFAFERVADQLPKDYRPDEGWAKGE
ncbi:MAG: carboxypeptidase-like regulatory domain-containing protein [Bacteroidetes bacterium]|nr:carboxypeptidase-like regulatory domain-containing protein [Bacteroidota bacterium]